MAENDIEALAAKAASEAFPASYDFPERDAFTQGYLTALRSTTAEPNPAPAVAADVGEHDRGATKLIAFLEEAACYFANRPTGGEDKAMWANVYNSENCTKTVQLIRLLFGDIKDLDEQVATWAVKYHNLTRGPNVISALQAIANLPTGRNEDVMEGHEQAYRAVEALFTTPPHIEARPTDSAAKDAEIADQGAWEQVGFYKEKLRHAEQCLEEAKDANVKLVREKQALQATLANRGEAGAYTGAGDLDAGTPNHFDHTKRGFNP